ncbi:ankyrin repeat-containing domain protein [Cladorrhinum sp. PSN259]|nr:ankyrin repeat-containing domain protein [Cladorrhinum sp. PSN259]
MSTLRTKDPGAFMEARSYYKTRFWAFCHGLTNDFISQLQVSDWQRFSADKDPRSGFTRLRDNLLHCAALVGSETVARYCLDAGNVDINAVNLRGETALFLSCKSGHSHIVKLLLARGANPCVCNCVSENVLHWLESFEDEDVAIYAAEFVRSGVNILQQSQLDEMFMENIAREYFHRYVPGTHDALHIAILRWDHITADFLLSHGYGKLSLQTPISSTRVAKPMSMFPLALATLHQDVQMANILLSHGADPESPMIWLAGTSSPQAIPALHLLLKTAWGAEAFSLAKLLVCFGANVNSVLPHDPRETPLSRALSERYFDIASFLISQGTYLNPPTPGHHPQITGLALFAVNNILDRSLYSIYEFLIPHPDTDIPFWVRVNVETVFHSLFKTKEVYRRNLDADNIGAIFRMLRRRFPERESLMIRDIRGWTALHHAVFNANLAGVRILLEAGFDVKMAIRREKEKVWELVKGWVVGRDDGVQVEEVYGEIWEEWGFYEGMSAMEMARKEIFEEVPLPVRDDPEEMGEFLERRREIGRLFIGWEG